jgi:CHASE2 domain-containing sensor protein
MDGHTGLTVTVPIIGTVVCWLTLLWLWWPRLVEAWHADVRRRMAAMAEAEREARDAS